MSSKLLQLVAIFSLITTLTAISCKSNQYYAPDGSCVSCIANCTTCSNAQYCTSCSEGFFLVSGSSSVTCQNCAQIFVGCTSCISNIACTNCVNGYFLNLGFCFPCSNKIQFCNNCSSDGSTCNQCKYPFILEKNSCVSGTVSSITGGQTGAPSGSTPPNNASTITFANGTTVPVVLDSNGCNQLQVYYLNKCIRRINNCQIYEPNGLCSFCLPGFTPTIYGDCSLKNRNLACESGYWLDSKKDTCVKVSPACDWYWPNNGSCVNCSKGYALINNSCVQNISCNSRQFFYAGTCVDVPFTCPTFSPVDGACTSCVTGYTLESGICTPSQIRANTNNCKFPCKTCREYQPTFCYSCVIYYQLAGAQYGTCVAVPKWSFIYCNHKSLMHLD